MKLVHIGCSMTKLPQPEYKDRRNDVLPVELYGGQLFRKRVAQAEEQGLPWMVLSAKYGLWRPTIRAAPYDLSFRDLNPAERAIWHVKVAYDVLHELWEPFEQGEADGPLKPADFTVVIQAGRDYYTPLDKILTAAGVNVEIPCKGMGIGKQLAACTPRAELPNLQAWAQPWIIE